jgi:hypothetical protein
LSADLSVELRRFDPRVAEQTAYLLEIAVLLVDLHRHAVTKVWGFNIVQPIRRP